MFTCPMCKKSLPDLPRQCPSCRTDLTLLTDFTDHLQTGLQRAVERTRSGRLGEAVWEYLQVLEVDPDNPTARDQVGQVVTAVRQFDRTAPGRIRLSRERRRERLQRWLQAVLGDRDSLRWLTVALLFLMMLASAGAGFWGGYVVGSQQPPTATEEGEARR